MQVQGSYGSSQQLTRVTKLWELKFLEYLYLEVLMVKHSGGRSRIFQREGEEMAGILGFPNQWDMPTKCKLQFVNLIEYCYIRNTGIATK